MTRFRRPLLRLLALLMLLQSGVAVAHGLRAMGAAVPWTVEICTGEGRRMMALGADGEPASDEAPGAEAFCPACHALPEVVLPGPTAPSAAIRYAAVLSWQVGPAPAERPRQRAPPQNPRAPPIPG